MLVTQIFWYSKIAIQKPKWNDSWQHWLIKHKHFKSLTSNQLEFSNSNFAKHLIYAILWSGQIVGKRYNWFRAQRRRKYLLNHRIIQKNRSTKREQKMHLNSIFDGPSKFPTGSEILGPSIFLEKWCSISIPFRWPSVLPTWMQNYLNLNLVELIVKNKLRLEWSLQ